MVQKDRPFLLLVLTHLSWTVGCTILCLLMFVRLTDLSCAWYDTATFAVVILISIGLITTIPGGIRDPLARGWLASCLRGIPHITLAAKILLFGGGGLALGTILAAHATATIRIIQLVHAVKVCGWKRLQIGIAIGEFANEGTWIIVTIAWCISVMKT